MTSPRLKRITAPPPLPARPDDSHKGTFGTVCVLGGSATMLGAPTLTARAALRVGAGLARLCSLKDLLPHLLTIEPSATGVIVPDDGDSGEAEPGESDPGAWFAEQDDEKNVYAVGPGIGIGPSARAWVMAAVSQARPVVLDADGLNNLSIELEEAGTFDTSAPLVVTPHPGEFARLAEPLGIDASPTEPDERPAAAAALAEKLGSVVVLKGRHTVVTDGGEMYINQTGNPALATAGTGDVLTGAIAGLIAQKMSPLDAAVLGVYLHGSAADRWAEKNGPAGLIARDLADLLPTAMLSWKRRHA